MPRGAALALALAALTLAGCSTTPTVATDQSPPSASNDGWNYLVVLDVNGSTIATFNHPRNPGICAKV